jgi:hypothetical protein
VTTPGRTPSARSYVFLCSRLSVDQDESPYARCRGRSGWLAYFRSNSLGHSANAQVGALRRRGNLAVFLSTHNGAHPPERYERMSRYAAVPATREHGGLR